MFSCVQPIYGGVVAEVVLSDNPDFQVGDTVLGNLNFSEYVVVPKGQDLIKVDASQVPASYYLGVLGKAQLDFLLCVLRLLWIIIFSGKTCYFWMGLMLVKALFIS